MQAMVLEAPLFPLKYMKVPIPSPKAGQLLIRVHACGICRTDLHIYDNELTQPKLPLILGHQIVGTVVEIGDGVTSFHINERIGVPWLQDSCHTCPYCLAGRENLCDNAVFTGYHVDGGLAEYCVAPAEFCLRIPQSYTDLQAAPLLCAGLIGYRALKMTGESKNVGLYGFGSSAHILAQICRYQNQNVYAFTRPGDLKTQEFARKLGAIWAGGAETPPPKPMDAAIIFAPSGALVPQALKCLDKGGTVVCAGIHMSDIPSFPYNLLWEERIVRSVANLTKQDGKEFMELAQKIHLHTTVKEYKLQDANQALDDLRHGRFNGSAVVRII